VTQLSAQAVGSMTACHSTRVFQKSPTRHRLCRCPGCGELQENPCRCAETLHMLGVRNEGHQCVKELHTLVASNQTVAAAQPRTVGTHSRAALHNDPNIMSPSTLSKPKETPQPPPGLPEPVGAVEAPWIIQPPPGLPLPEGANPWTQQPLPGGQPAGSWLSPPLPPRVHIGKGSNSGHSGDDITDTNSDYDDEDMSDSQGEHPGHVAFAAATAAWATQLAQTDPGSSQPAATTAAALATRPPQPSVGGGTQAPAKAAAKATAAVPGMPPQCAQLPVGQHLHTCWKGPPPHRRPSGRAILQQATIETLAAQVQALQFQIHALQGAFWSHAGWF